MIERFPYEDVLLQQDLQAQENILQLSLPFTLVLQKLHLFNHSEAVKLLSAISLMALLTCFLARTVQKFILVKCFFLPFSSRWQICSKAISCHSFYVHNVTDFSKEIDWERTHTHAIQAFIK